MTDPYRSTPPLARLAPRTSWHRLAWAWCRGVFDRMNDRRYQQGVNDMFDRIRTVRRPPKDLDA